MQGGCIDFSLLAEWHSTQSIVLQGVVYYRVGEQSRVEGLFEQFLTGKDLKLNGSFMLNEGLGGFHLFLLVWQVFDRAEM